MIFRYLTKYFEKHPDLHNEMIDIELDFVDKCNDQPLVRNSKFRPKVMHLAKLDEMDAMRRKKIEDKAKQ